MARIRAILLGAPGSGKGTQAERLASRLEVPAISTGEMLRAAVSAGTELGQRVEEILNSGAFVDDATMAEVVKTRLLEEDAADGFLLDGYPRNASQADTLDRLLSEIGAGLDVVWFIDVPEQELVRRALARQREDDRAEVIERRLEVYREQTGPLVERYRAAGLLRSVDGDRPVEAVTESILSELEVGA